MSKWTPRPKRTNANWNAVYGGAKKPKPYNPFCTCECHDPYMCVTHSMNCCWTCTGCNQRVSLDHTNYNTKMMKHHPCDALPGYTLIDKGKL